MAMAIPSPMAVQTHTNAASFVVGGATPPPTPLKEGTTGLMGGGVGVGVGGGFPPVGIAVSVPVPPSASLYVGDLDANVDESKLYDLFSQVAPVLSIRVCRDHQQNHLFRSLGYAYVNFNNPQDASYARDALNFTPINDKPMRIMFSHRDPTLRKSGYANLFIKNLDSSIDNKALYDTFAAFGTVLSCKVAYDHNGKPKGYGFVQFDKEESAQNARKRLTGMLINDKQVYVGPFVRRQERNEGKGSPKFSNVYVKNLSESTTDEGLKEMFGKFGPITSAIVMKDENGKSRCFGFINFENHDDAAEAVEKLNGTTVDDQKVLYVGRAEKKSEREAQLKAKFEQERNNRFEKLKGCNLYLKNIDDGINDEKLKELFTEFGTITSCKVVLDQNGVSKGAGFVAFSSPDEATKALNEMNGKMIGRKPLYVAVAQRKEERKNWLQTHFSQMRTPGTMSPMQGIRGIHPAGAAPRLAAPQQPLYFGQVSPAGLMSQAATAGYGFQQPHMPTGVMPGVPSNFVMPMQFQQQGQRAQRVGPRRGANSHQPQQQQRNSNHTNNHVGSRFNGNAVNGPQVRTGSAMPSTLSKSTLASSLASASPENRRMMLGEHLYPLVESLEPNHAGKVTGMLLEMDQTEVLHLIDSPDALKKKVMEAMDVLRLATTDHADQAF